VTSDVAVSTYSAWGLTDQVIYDQSPLIVDGRVSSHNLVSVARRSVQLNQDVKNETTEFKTRVKDYIEKYV
jgi:hypothetical protein